MEPNGIVPRLATALWTLLILAVLFRLLFGG